MLVSPDRIDMDRVKAQEARRAMDRVVGFPLAPLDRTGVPAWKVGLFLEDGRLPGAMPSGGAKSGLRER